jgi:hypothetical protein
MNASEIILNKNKNKIIESALVHSITFNNYLNYISEHSLTRKELWCMLLVEPTFVFSITVNKNEIIKINKSLKKLNKILLTEFTTNQEMIDELDLMFMI